MDAGHWQTIKKILNDALEVDPEKRPDFLRAACGDDQLLHHEVEELLSYDTNGSHQLETPAAAAIVGNGSAAQVGRVIGRYRIVGELGEGGMGTVYLAERSDGEFHQKVAMKLIRRGLNSDKVVDRFVNERGILATLEHPNIARLIDGGTTDDGVPYFVMEYVDGQPILEHVRDKGCNIDARLSLFIDICAAVTYAHRNLIIHRDLKPSNVLITADGDVKLLDFGIAKVLDPTLDGDAPTQQIALTPEYASPEQLRGERLTTATDIYSLGVILFELLTGVRPLDTKGKSLGEAIKTVCEAQPRRPSSVVQAARNGTPVEMAGIASDDVTRRLRGDLDSIVLKALRKEPSARYPSVNAFANDIGLHIAGQPVSARSGVWSYRAKKFIVRNRIAVIGAGVVFVTLIAGLITTLYQARVARDERARAERRFNDVRQLADSFVFEINDEIEKSPIRARALVVQRAVEYLDSLSSEAGDDNSLKAELAAAYEKIGEVQADLFQPNLGNAGDALVSQRKALELRSALFEGDHTDIARGLDVARSHLLVGNILTVTGDIQAAAAEYRHAIEITETLAAGGTSDGKVGLQLSNSYLLLGQAILRGGSLSESLANYQKAFSINERLLAADPSNIDLLRRQSVAHSYIGYVKGLMGNADMAVQDFEAALAIEEQVAASDPGDGRLARARNTAVLWAGYGYREAGRISDALPKIQEALRLQQKTVKADPADLGEQNALADCWLELAQTHEKARHYPEALSAYRRAITIYSSVSGHDDNDLSSRFQIQHTKRFLANCLSGAGKNAESLHTYQEAAAPVEDLLQRDSGNLEWRYELAMCRLGIGKGELAVNRSDDRAAEPLKAALVALEDLHAASPENVRYEHDLAQAKAALASIK